MYRALSGCLFIGAGFFTAEAGRKVRRVAGDLSYPTTTNITALDGQLLVNGVPFHMKGICWNPVGKGGTHPANLDFRGFAEADADVMKAAGINVMRPYDPITDTYVLDVFHQRGIYVVNSVYSWGGASVQSAVDVVRAVKGHPAIIMWAIGNEWNYNGLYFGLSFNDARARVADVVKAIKQVDQQTPVSTVYGELPDATTLRILSEVDIWGINAYRGAGFQDLFTSWKSRSSKPMYLGEYGADAFDARINAPNYSAQAYATRVLTQEIYDNSFTKGGVCLGGFIFELADEWWKDDKGSPDVHDEGGIAPGGGPYPDATFNEEWWGLVDIDRKPREAYNVYKSMLVPQR